MKKIPEQYTVPGTKFTVDWHSFVSDEYKHSFLSHTHTDHLTGIRSFKPPRVLHCSEITAKLISLKIPKLAECLEVHEFGKDYTIDGVTVRLFPAFHTPGSSMFLFTLPNGKKILHTGDFRAERQVIDSITPYAPIYHGFIDCTYGTSNLQVPPRAECEEFIATTIKLILKSQPNAVFWIGTYTSGKEELVFHTADNTQCLVYADPERLKGIRELEKAGWDSAHMFTDDQSAAKIHLVSISACRIETMHKYASEHEIPCIVGFAATGWSARPDWKAPSTQNYNDSNVILYSIPYSDHCSTVELKEFVRAIKPSKITSTTARSASDQAKTQKLFDPLLNKKANREFLDYYM